MASNSGAAVVHSRLDVENRSSTGKPTTSTALEPAATMAWRTVEKLTAIAVTRGTSRTTSGRRHDDEAGPNEGCGGARDLKPVCGRASKHHDDHETQSDHGFSGNKCRVHAP